jgi:hypothetical protein
MTSDQQRAVRQFVQDVLDDPASGFTPYTLYGNVRVLPWVIPHGTPARERLENFFREHFPGENPKRCVNNPKGWIRKYM